MKIDYTKSHKEFVEIIKKYYDDDQHEMIKNTKKEDLPLLINTFWLGENEEYYLKRLKDGN